MPDSDCCRCGACCRAAMLEADAADAAREPRIARQCPRAKRPPERYLVALGPRQRCPFLAGPPAKRTCLIYDTRPRACREIPPGGETCRQARREQEMKP